jgi:hypothetical protein
MLRPGRLLQAILAATLILNGCILERIFRVKDQLCEFEKKFKIEIAEGFRVVLLEPVMLDEDITWLAGAQPSERYYVGNELVMIYIAEKIGNPRNGHYDIPVELRFVRRDQGYLLKEGYLGKNLTDILTDELLTQIMQSVCRSEKSLARQQITVDISSLQSDLLPSKADIVRILGPPNRRSEDEQHLTYDYQIRNNAARDAVAAIEIQFDRLGETIAGIRLNYLRYCLNADFQKGEAILRVHILPAQKPSPVASGI